MKIDEKLEEIRKEFKAKGVPVMLEDSFELLLKTAEEKQPNSILEIGTAVGCSAIAMAMLCPNAHIVTLEKNVELAEKAKANFKAFKVENRIELVLGDAADYLDKQATLKDKKFDFVFLDGPKGQYLSYLEKILEIVDNKGILVADNVLFRGYVFGEECPKRYRTIAKNLRKFLDKIQADENYETKIYELGDGVSVSRKII